MPLIALAVFVMRPQAESCVSGIEIKSAQAKNYLGRGKMSNVADFVEYSGQAAAITMQRDIGIGDASGVQFCQQFAYAAGIIEA